MRILTLGFTPDPDDAFAYYALVNGRISTDGWKVSYSTAPIEELNRHAERQLLDIAAISSVFYPRLAHTYAVLRSGASVGRGYGPALVTKAGEGLGVLEHAEVAVPGDTTTGANLLQLFFPGVETVALSFDAIREAIAHGEVDAGILIHEELLNYPELGLERLLCLGEEWSRRTAVPLPVGLNVLHRRHEDALAADISRCVRESIEYALAHREEATAWARQFGRGPQSKVGERFIRMFANDDTVEFGRDCEQGLTELFRRLADAGLAPRLSHVDFIESDPAAWQTRLSTAPEPRDVAKFSGAPHAA